MKTTVLVLVLALAATTHADQLATLPDKAVARRATRLIKPGTKIVEWISHTRDSKPKLSLVKEVRVRRTSRGYQVEVTAQAIAERGPDGAWTWIQGAKPRARAVDLAYLYLPRRVPQDTARQVHCFVNMARILKLELVVKQEKSLVVPLEIVGFWNLVGAEAIDAMGDAIAKLLDEWLTDHEDWRRFYESLGKSRPANQNHSPALHRIAG